MITCRGCWRPKTDDQFVSKYGRPTKLCQKCRDRRYAYQKEFNKRTAPNGMSQGKMQQLRLVIDPEEYERLLATQDYKCAICKRPREENTLGRRFAVDHDHNTGLVRGLLCYKCNTGLGALNDDPELLQTAADYLRLDRPNAPAYKKFVGDPKMPS